MYVFALGAELAAILVDDYCMADVAIFRQSVMAGP